MSATINGMPAATAYAVGARNLTKVQTFADKFGFQKAYGSYEELVADPNMDLIYVAPPILVTIHTHPSPLPCIKYTTILLGVIS